MKKVTAGREQLGDFALPFAGRTAAVFNFRESWNGWKQ